MTRKKVLLLGQFKYRDLPGLALVKVLLERRGPYDVSLLPEISSLGVQLYQRQAEFDAVIVPQYMNRIHIEQAHRLQQHGVGVCVLPAEGNSLIPEVRLQMAGVAIDVAPVDLFFIWNQAIAALARSRDSVPADRVVVGGVPRFDLYHPRFRRLFMTKRQFCDRYHLDPAKPIITWATNFGWAPYSEESSSVIDGVVERYHAQYGLSDSTVYRDIRGLIDKETESRDTVSRTMLAIARQHPEASLVIKIHPVEKGPWYAERMAAAGLKNVTLITREYIWNVLNATDVHVHRACTTAIEAWFLNKPTIDTQFSPREWYFDREMADGGDVARSAEQCADLVTYYLGGGAIPAEQKAVRPSIIESWAGRVDGRSAERHADALHTWLQALPATPRMPALTWSDLQVGLTVRAKAMLGLKPYHSIRAWIQGEPQDPRDKYFTPEETSQWVRAIASALDGTIEIGADTRSA